MTERQRAALAAAIQNPDLLDRLHGQAQPAPQDPVFPNDLAQPETPAPQRGGREDEMSQMRQAIAFLLQDAQERQNEKRATTKDRELEVEVGRWPWLQKDPGAHAYVLERTREAMALNPTADVRSVVNKHVAALQALLNRAPMPAPQPGREQVELVPARQPLANGYAATGKDLARGSSLRGAAAFVDRFERMRR
jgi:hypothetical protein